MMYSVGDCVVYGVHGVCRVAGFEKQLVGRKRTEYLVLEPINQNESRYYLPTGNPAAMAKLKSILTADEMRQLIASEEVRKDCWISDENQRKQRYRDLISCGERVSILQMVCSLYRYKAEQEAAGRKFHLSDENFLRDAEKLLSSEIALVLEMTPEEARSYLRQELK